MTTWTFVDGTLSDGLPIRVYLAAGETELVAAALSDEAHPKSDVEFEWRAAAGENWSYVPERSAAGVLRQAAQQVREYFSGKRTSFNVPLKLNGTNFQAAVWRELTEIPFGATESYGDVAEAIGQPSAFRAVGNANGRNCIPLFIPCHRVIAAGGKLGGFTGGLGLKKRLLAHEAAVVAQSPSAASPSHVGHAARQTLAHL